MPGPALLGHQAVAATRRCGPERAVLPDFTTKLQQRRARAGAAPEGVSTAHVQQQAASQRTSPQQGPLGARRRSAGHERALPEGQSPLQGPLQALGQAVAAVALSLALTTAAGPAQAADTVKVGVCLLQKCQGALARCLGDVECIKSIACLQTCNGRPDEAACQQRCGDLYNTPATDEFTMCAVTQQHCVEQRVDVGTYVPPPDCALSRDYNVEAFTGKWYISAGVNPLFDTFPCQDHYLNSPRPGQLDVLMNWRVEKDSRSFIHRSFVQHFTTTEGRPAVLHNGGNSFLHYQDDWFILAAKQDKYFMVWYRGSNDAWNAYGGAVVYTREPSLPAEYIPELRAAAENAGLNWADFQLTDNTCGPAPPSTLQQVGQFAQKATSDLERLGESTISTLFGGKPVQAAEQGPLGAILPGGGKRPS